MAIRGVYLENNQSFYGKNSTYHMLNKADGPHKSDEPRKPIIRPMAKKVTSSLIAFNKYKA